MLPRERTEDAARTRAAIVALYETHFDRVARYIAARIGSVSEAEDLASEVFVRALRSSASYEKRGAPMEAWVFQIAHNAVVDHLRKRTRRPALVPLDEAEDSLASEEDPAEGMERQQELSQLRMAMEHLSQAQHQVLFLRFTCEMTSEQIAQAIGKRPGAVREMQSAAIKKIRQVLTGGP